LGGLNGLLQAWRQALPEALWPLWDALVAPTTLRWVAGVSLALAVTSLAALPWLLARLPVDWLTRPAPALRRRGWQARLVWVVRNVAALLLLLAGVAMLVLPGQGALTILVALSVSDWPGKQALERRLVARAPVLAAIDALRRRGGAPPLQRPPGMGDHAS
jgi:hypothetical protein